MYVGSWGTETSMVNTAQPGEEALLMTAGQAQIQIICFYHKGSSEKTHRAGPDSGASSTLNPCGESPSYTVSGEVWKEE